MSLAGTLDTNKSSGSLNKVIALGISAFAVIEAVLSYFLVIGPLFIKPIYALRDQYNLDNGEGYCIVKVFGKAFASVQEVADHTIILSLSSQILNIILIYLIMTVSVILLAMFFYKGFAFAKSYLTFLFGAKGVIGLSAIIVPFTSENFKMIMKIFGVGDAVICFALCLYFVYLNIQEYADDMLYDSVQTAGLVKRMIEGGVMFVMLTASMVLEAVAVGYASQPLGGYFSIYMNMLDDTSLAQGAVLALIVAVGLAAVITYTREADWAEFFFFAFGTAAAVTDLIGIIRKATSTGVGTSTILLIVAFAAAAALTAFSFLKIKNKLHIGVDAANKKASVAVLISVGSLVLSFILMVAANTLYNKMRYGTSFAIGAMDYIYFMVYGGLTIFLAVSMLGGYSFTKFGSLALYLLVASNAFENIFVTFSARAAYAAATGLRGYNYMISGVLYILCLLSCLGIIAAFAVKNVDDYLYAKRYS